MAKVENNVIKKPFLKWAGSKTRLIVSIRPYLAAGDYRYVEPFVGSGAVFLNTDYSESLLCDSNADLINLYSVLKAKKTDFVKACKELSRQRTTRRDGTICFAMNSTTAAQASAERACSFT